MSEAALGAPVLQLPDFDQGTTRDKSLEEPQLLDAKHWDPERFARNQICGLVRQVFCSNSATPVRQIAVSAIEQETEIIGICRKIGEVLAMETSGRVAVIGGHLEGFGDGIKCGEDTRVMHNEQSSSFQFAPRLQRNVWLLPKRDNGPKGATVASLHKYLAEIRREYDYSILEAPPARELNEAVAMAQFADGMILVLSTQYTRRAIARKVREILAAARVRLLGIVLSDREFPIPERIYRRL